MDLSREGTLAAKLFLIAVLVVSISLLLGLACLDAYRRAYALHPGSDMVKKAEDLLNSGACCRRPNGRADGSGW